MEKHQGGSGGRGEGKCVQGPLLWFLQEEQASHGERAADWPVGIISAASGAQRLSLVPGVTRAGG